MKRIATAFLALVMVFSLAACGSGSKGPKLEGSYEDGSGFMGAIQFNKDGTFYMGGGLLDLFSSEDDEWITATYYGTFAFGDDNKTVYLKSDAANENKIELLNMGLSYDESADVVVVTISGVTYNFFKSDVVLKLPTDNDTSEEVQDETTEEIDPSISDAQAAISEAEVKAASKAAQKATNKAHPNDSCYNILSTALEIDEADVKQQVQYYGEGTIEGRSCCIFSVIDYTGGEYLWVTNSSPYQVWFGRINDTVGLAWEGETNSEQESGSDDVGYDEWAEAADEPYKQRTYYGQTAEALAAVKAHCTWYDSWVKNEFPNGLTNGYYCDWQIDQVSETTWIGSLFAADFSGAWAPYEFTVEYNGTEYVITQEQDNR